MKSNFPEPEILVKFCNPVHNIADDWRTIKVGTLEYYRGMEKSSPIADEEEGIERSILTDYDAGHPSRKNYMESFGISCDGATNVKIINCTHTSSTNCYIWCCSRLPKTLTMKQIAQFGVDQFGTENTSRYSVTDPEMFAEYLRSLLLKFLSTSTIKNLPNDIPPDIPIRTLRGKIDIRYDYREVIYVPNKELIVQEGQIRPYVYNISKDLRPIFIKPDRFKENKEFRFSFRFVYNWNQVLQVQKNPVFLEILAHDVPKLPVAAL